MKAEEIKANLNGYYGGDECYLHFTRMGRYTEGVKYLADNAGAYWLIDKIITLQLERSIRQEEFQQWTLNVNADATASLKCDDGNGTIVYTEIIEYTDFPLPEMKLWYENSMLYLPQER